MDLSFVKGLGHALSGGLTAQLDAADRLAPIMASSSKIGGNPRLIKRFLNALAIRRQIAKRHGISISEPALAKLLLLERCGSSKAYGALANSVNGNAEGKPRFLADWEEQAVQGKQVDREDPWNELFVLEWLRLPPRLADLDLRRELYVSRENFPLIRPHDRLTSRGAELLEALLREPRMAGTIAEDVRSLSAEDLDIVMARLLERAGQEQEWGAPGILNACIVIADASAAQADRLAAFLQERPPSQIKADIIPKLRDKLWARGVLKSWLSVAVAAPVKKAITSQLK